jgi:hypothetical protein
MEMGISQLPGNEKLFVHLENAVQDATMSQPGYGAPSTIRLNLRHGTEFQAHWEDQINGEADSLGIKIDAISLRYGDDVCGSRSLMAIEVAAIGDSPSMDALCASLSGIDQDDEVLPS